MLNKIANRWKTHQQQHTARPAYLLIADIIADGINSGEFQPRDRSAGCPALPAST